MTATTELRDRIRAGQAIGEIGQWLDSLDHAARLPLVMTLRRRDQIQLWDLAGDAEEITLEHFVPPGTAPCTEVIHHGRNTLPLFNFFQKRFCIQAEGERVACGYNEGSTRWFLGPGYFVLHDTTEKAEWAERGAWVVDYFQVPTGNVVPSWPRIKPNSSGLQRFVFHRTRDFMRRVSSHVSIGRAWKVESAMPAWFVLCREP